MSFRILYSQFICSSLSYLISHISDLLHALSSETLAQEGSMPHAPCLTLFRLYIQVAAAFAQFQVFPLRIPESVFKTE